ncbi:hypothetical protein GCM10027425_00810 [Alteromonas gracilis]
MSTPRSEVVEAVRAAHRSGEPLTLATSGTSGTPRRIVRTTSSWWDSFDAYTALSGVEAGARVWVPGPEAATMNLFALVHAAEVGAEVVAEADEATHALLTPALLERDGGGLRPGTHVTVAGGPLPRQVVERHPGLRLAHYYGAAELSFVAAGPCVEELHPFPGVEVRIRAGAIEVRSPYVCQGYADGAPGPLVRDGEWAGVGDRGVLFDGVLRVLGRPGWIQTAGATVAAADVTAVLSPLAAGDVVVLGVPRDDVGEVVAIVLTDPGDAPGLRRAARSLLPSSHRPRLWLHAASLPLTEAGKTDLVALTQQATALPRL